MADLKFLVDDWPAISGRLDEALSLAPQQRDAWLAALDEPDPVKHKLQQLLVAAMGVETGDFLAALPRLTVDAQASAAAADAATAGSLIGPYRLIRELGVGGMGLVWLAERADAGLKRQVALKLPRLSWSSGLAARMNRERDILVSLDHPNIARIHDAGVDAHGRPYLALEYVEGEAIDLYCRRLALSIAERIGLVLQVARAVAHAHARLVVHRDLKPANILVNAQGEVRLLDFGIAKLMEGELSVESQLTRQAGRALTPDYASPEQIRGESIGTASDVYSLGVVAYELLAQAKPYQLKRQSAAALEEAIAGVDVRLASSAAASRPDSRVLKGDLDAILNQALKKNVAERYASVDAFAQDLERYLAKRPVLAQPDTWAYRLRKFLRRNKLPLAAGSAVAALLIAGLGVTILQRREAVAQAERAQRVKDFIGSVFAAADPYVAGKPGGTVRDLLDAAASRIERELQQEPATAAELLGMLADSYANLGELDRSLNAAQRAHTLAALAFPARHPLRPRLMRVLAQAHEAKGGGDEARRLLREAVAMQRQPGGDADELALSLIALASAELDRGREGEPVVLVREAVQVLERAHGSKHALTVQAIGQLSNKLMIAGQAPEALVQAERAVRAARRLYPSADHPALVRQLSHYANALNFNGRTLEAREQWQAIVAADRRAFNPRGPQVSDVLLALGHAQMSLGELKDALASYEESLSIMQGFGAQPSGELAIRHFSVARAALLARQADRALASIDRAIAIGSQAYGADSARVKDALYLRGEALLRAGRLAEAQSLLDRRIAEDRAGAAPGLQRGLRIRSLLDQARGDWQSALAYSREAAAMTAAPGLGGAKVPAQQRAELGRLWLETGRLDEAASALEPAIQELQTLEPTATPQQADAWLALARVRLRQGRVAEALPGLQRADAFWRSFAPEQASAGEAAYWLGQGLAEAGDPRAAQVQELRARPLLAAAPWPVLRRLGSVAH
jgi:eukaryotic-like serine/threonine-protein kinase